MAWDNQDKGAAMVVVLEMAARMKAEDIFLWAVRMASMLGEGNNPLQHIREPSELAECLRECLRDHGLLDPISGTG